MNFEEKMERAIAELSSTQVAQMNHQLANEAMLEALLDLRPLEALPAIAGEYAAALLRLAEALPPDMQRPDIWLQWTTYLAGRQLYLQRRAGLVRTPGEG